MSLMHHRLKLNDECLESRHEYALGSGLWRMSRAVHPKEFSLVRMQCYTGRQFFLPR